MRLIDADKLIPDRLVGNGDSETLAISGNQIENSPTVDAIPREILKNIVYSYKMLDKQLEDLTPFENSIISLVCQIDAQHWKLWAGEYDNE